MKNYQASMQTPFGHIGLYFVDNRLAVIDFIDAEHEIRPRDNAVIEVCAQIRKYIENAETIPSFDVSFYSQGTPFQQESLG